MKQAGFNKRLSIYAKHLRGAYITTVLNNDCNAMLETCGGGGGGLLNVCTES